MEVRCCPKAALFLRVATCGSPPQPSSAQLDQRPAIGVLFHHVISARRTIVREQEFSDPLVRENTGIPPSQLVPALDGNQGELHGLRFVGESGSDVPVVPRALSSARIVGALLGVRLNRENVANVPAVASALCPPWIVLVETRDHAGFVQDFHA